MRILNSEERIIFSKSLINSEEVLKKDFFMYLGEIIGDRKLEELKFNLDYFLIEYLKNPTSLNKQYRKFEKVDIKLLERILLGIPYPRISEIISYLNFIKFEQRGFCFLDFIWLLNSFAIYKIKEEGVLPASSVFKVSNKERAENQTKRMIKKDLSGLLGVEKLFTKEPKKTPRHYPKSVWTVKKR